MKSIMEQISGRLREAFSAAGYDPKYGEVKVSDRPDLCEYQCNGAMAAAKTYHKAPFRIADDVAAQLTGEAHGFTAEVVRPGFINIRTGGAFLAAYLEEMAEDPHFSVPQEERPKKIVIDYGGPNVAKPLHVGHLRAAVIGESVKRITRAVGNEVLGDVHLGDWGLQMGLIITELKHRRGDLPYFREDVSEYPEEAPFTIGELEEIYPAASARSKEDEAYRAEAMEATHLLQMGHPGYTALWNQILAVSVADLKRNYERLNVAFDLWKSESDAQPYIPALVEDLKVRGIARYDDGALVVDVSEESDKKEIPPCIVLKSDGASLYSTTDIATIVERMKLFAPDEIIYVVDKRQAMHFVQVFRTVRKAGIVSPETVLVHVGFGTMNGRDGKPFKTRDGGVMRLEILLDEIVEEMTKKIRDNKNVRAEDAERIAELVSVAAVKYGDLSNQAAKDYVFDTEKFTSFEGNTGPYILYTIVRVKSILGKAEAGDAAAASEAGALLAPASGAEKALMLDIAGLGQAVYGAYEELAPHRICAYVYQLANDLNRFYHETKILSEEDAERRISYLRLLSLAKRAMELCIDLLGFEAPEHM